MPWFLFFLELPLGVTTSVSLPLMRTMRGMPVGLPVETFFNLILQPTCSTVFLPSRKSSLCQPSSGSKISQVLLVCSSPQPPQEMFWLRLWWDLLQQQEHVNMEFSILSVGKMGNKGSKKKCLWYKETGHIETEIPLHIDVACVPELHAGKAAGEVVFPGHEHLHWGDGVVAAVLSSGDQDTSHVVTLFMEFLCTLCTLYTIQQNVLESQ